MAVTKKKAKKDKKGRPTGKGSRGQYKKKGGVSNSKKVLELMEKNPDKLFTAKDLEKVVDSRNPGNIFALLLGQGRVMKHKDKVGLAKQYAINIPEEDRFVPFSLGDEALPTATEIRATISPVIRLLGKLEEHLPELMKLEQIAIDAVDRVHDMERKMEKGKALFDQ